MGKTLTILLGLFLASITSAHAQAMDFGAVFQEAQIEEVTLSPANEKGISTLRFRFTNLAVSDLTIIGVVGANHSNSRIMAELEPQKFVKLDSLLIPEEESLDMINTGIFVQLIDMKKVGKPGDRVELKLVLTNGELPFTAQIMP